MEALRYFFPGDCYEEVVVKLNVFDVVCLKLLNSRLLSLGVILGSVLVKFPQIIKCLRARSVENLSYLAFLLELSACTIMCVYNLAKGFPFSAWGESFFIAIQVVILLVIMFHFNNHRTYMALFLPTYFGIVWYLTSDLVSMELLSLLQAAVTPMMVISRLSQITTTFLNKTTGQLSLITSTLNWLGAASRIFTTIQETQDTLILINYVAMFAINSFILIQFAIYWNAPSKTDTEKKKAS